MDREASGWREEGLPVLLVGEDILVSVSEKKGRFGGEKGDVFLFFGWGWGGH